MAAVITVSQLFADAESKVYLVAFFGWSFVAALYYAHDRDTQEILRLRNQVEQLNVDLKEERGRCGEFASTAEEAAATSRGLLEVLKDRLQVRDAKDIRRKI